MRILLADDHDLVRDSIEEFLKRLDRDVQVLHAATLPQALELAQQDVPLDAILLDLRMPGMNGLAGLRAMRAARAGVPVVVISGETDPDTVRGALQAGAAGFLPKTMRGTAMLGALRLILSGERYVPDLVVAAGGEPAPAGPSGSSFGGLTQREREVMSLLVQGLPNKEIGQRLKIEVVTVALHLRSIYRKLGVSSRTQAVRLAMQQGWDS
ncbi:MAG TPA: response regulator transcription factor [Methylomirabilota bacterium]|nr:response regulator transcription factor [Methylomirabilota bacterium]